MEDCAQQPHHLQTRLTFPLQDLLTGDEIISDTSKIIDAGNGLWEVDGRMIKKGAENFVLEGANPSAEGEDADEGDDAGGSEPVLVDPSV